MYLLYLLVVSAAVLAVVLVANKDVYVDVYM
jgi:hypothetical protein